MPADPFGFSFDSNTGCLGCASKSGHLKREVAIEALKPRKFPCLLRQKRQRLQLRNLKRLAASDVGAGNFVVAAHHVGLCLGKAGPVALVRAAWQLRPFAADHPADFVFASLAALGAGQRVAAKFCSLVEKIPLFHSLRCFPSRRFYSILMVAPNGSWGRNVKPETKADR
jgi:hypothetical protein